MSEYQGKPIELIAIHKQKDQYYLQIKLILEPEIELFWKIDETMAIQFEKITNFEKRYRYTLSYYTFWNPSQNEFRSYLTKTFLEYNERIYFSCSEEYLQIIDQLKQIQDCEQIHTLSFLSTQAPNEQQEMEINNDQKEDTDKKNWNFNPYKKYTLIAAIIFSMLSISYLGYTNLSFNETEQVKAKEVSTKAVATITEDETNDASTEKKKPTISVAKLENTVNYDIPKGKVALTFDDGPSKYSKDLVNVLKKYNAGGTFFYIGTRVKQYPEYVRYTKKNGYSIGSHSMTHAKFTKLPIKSQEKEILQTDQLIKKITGDSVVLFRPPYGAKNNSTIKLAEKYDLDIVLWKIDTLDWKSRNAKKILQAVKKEKASGSIILLHESQATLEALPDIIEYLQKKDLEIVSLQGNKKPS